MPKRLRLEGRKFGRLMVLAIEDVTDQGKIRWRCGCECGQQCVTVGARLISGATTSCGCARTDGHSNFRHGHKRKEGGSRAYLCWTNMKRRCNGSAPGNRKDYHDRGITYDPAWESFQQFLADMGEPPEGTSIDRIDNDGPYCKTNCRWANRVSQARNRRSTRWVMVKGDWLPLAKAVEKYGTVSYALVQSRLHRGWPEEEAVLAPVSEGWSRRNA